MNLREATAADSLALLYWRNDIAARVGSRNGERIGEKDHARWLEEVLGDPDRFLLIAEDEGKRVGQVRFDRIGEGYEINLSIGPEWRGVGLGSELVKEATLWLWRTTEARWIQAIVRTENEPSRKAFLNAGFEGVKDNGFVCLVKERP